MPAIGVLREVCVAITAIDWGVSMREPLPCRAAVFLVSRARGTCNRWPSRTTRAFLDGM